MYIDSHCHLDMIELHGKKKVSSVVEEAKKKRVGLVVVNGINSKSNRKNLEYGKKYEIVRVAMGVYPEHALKMSKAKFDEELEFVRLHKDEIIGIGEVGMDFKVAGEKGKQVKNFERQIMLAMELNVPVIVHSRKAEKECIEVLEGLGAKKVIMHSFGGKKGLVKRIVENDWYMTIPTSVKNSEHFQNIVDIVPIEKLLCETDSPYMHPDKDFPNTPAKVVESYKMIAKVKSLKLKEVEGIIEGNFERLFGKR